MDMELAQCLCCMLQARSGGNKVGEDAGVVDGATLAEGAQVDTLPVSKLRLHLRVFEK
jgi:hypothetical protein